MLRTHQNKLLEDIKQTWSTNTLMTASWHVVAKLLTVCRMWTINIKCYRNVFLEDSYFDALIACCAPLSITNVISDTHFAYSWKCPLGSHASGQCEVWCKRLAYILNETRGQQTTSRLLHKLLAAPLVIVLVWFEHYNQSDLLEILWILRESSL